MNNFKYDIEKIIKENMMGPDAVVIAQELTENFVPKDGMRILDLGCGCGLSTIFLAEKCKNVDVKINAVDLWIAAEENNERFKKIGVDYMIESLQADALNLPFPENYFDAVVSIDSYHYFGNNDTYFAEKLKPLLKKGAQVAIAFPGMKYEVHNCVPEEMKPYWEEEALAMWHSVEWWRPKFEQHLDDFHIGEMKCFDTAWKNWLESDNTYAVEDRPMMKTDGGRFMNLISITGKIR